MDIHVTERSLFKECRRSWQYAYKEHLQRPEDRIDARWVGKGVHTGLAGYYKKKDIFDSFHDWLDKKLPQPKRDALPIEELRKFQEVVQLIESILQRYTSFAQRFDNFEVVAVEKPLSAHIPGTRTRLVGTLDLLVRQKGKLWVYDHKTCAGFVDPDYLDLDDQMTAYLWLVWKNYREFPAGAVFNQLRKKIPAEPHLLKSGLALSRDKSIDTTPEIYLEAIRKNNFDRSDYLDILEKLELNEFYRREPIPRNKTELINFEKHLTNECREMSSKRTPIYPSASRNCLWCDYRVLCKAENEGGDVDSLKEALFVVEEGRRI